MPVARTCRGAGRHSPEGRMDTGADAVAGKAEAEPPQDEEGPGEAVWGDEGAMARDLVRRGVCAVCTMRFLGCRAAFELSTQRLKEQFDITVPTGPDAPVCGVCEGLLTASVEPAFTDPLVEAVVEGGYEFDVFMLNVSLPLSMMLREFSMRLYLDQHYGVGFVDDSGEDKGPPLYVKEVLRWILGEAVKRKFEVPFHPDAPLKIDVVVYHTETKKEPVLLRQVDPTHFRQRRGQGSQISTGQVVAWLDKCDRAAFKRVFKCPPQSPETACEPFRIDCQMESVFIAGRYLKFDRELSQTPWLIQGVRKTESSVQELLSGHLLEALGSAKANFCSAGREDVDVRMLGTGRPYVLEICNPKRLAIPEDRLKEIEAAINSSTKRVQALDLRMVDKGAVNYLGRAAESKEKSYSCLVWTERDATAEDLAGLNGLEELVLQQLTPVRVLHRRTLVARPRTVHSMRCVRLKPHFLKVYLKTQAGTYIKEFIHGDFGRTQPNLGSLMGCAADILTLDVEEIHLAWPPPKEGGPS